jgi:hypothetical protein
MKTNKWRHAVLTWFTYTNTEKRAAMILVGLLFVLQITSWCLHYLPSEKVSGLPDPAVVMPEKKFAEYKKFGQRIYSKYPTTRDCAHRNHFAKSWF